MALAVPAAASAQQFPGLFTVDRTADELDGECTNDCTLREAVELAAGQQATIQVRPGVYRLTRGPLVLRSVTLFGAGLSGGFGAGARTTVIDAGGRSRAIEVPAGSSSTVAGVTVTGGSASNGAGIFVAAQGSLIIYNSEVRGNVAGGRGGGIHSAGQADVLFSTIAGNRVGDGSGGGIAVDAGGSGSMQQTTVSGNTATASGGGVYSAGDTIMQGVTIAGNTAQSGGALFQDAGSNSSVAMWNSILARGSSAGACGGTVLTGGFVTGNLSDDASCGFAPDQGVMNTDPLIAALTNNGGPTDTRALRAGSPAINAGNPQVCGIGRDQRWAPFVDNCDIGAFEFGGVPPAAEVPPPVAGETVNVSESRGRVRVKMPGSDEFFELEDVQQVPIGSTFDTSRGRVNLIAAGQQKSWFYQGVFRIGQTRGARPLSTLTLTGQLACGRGATVAQRRKKRRLWGNGRGKFRTRGKHSAATVVGTRWLVEDRCNGTLTRVTKGRVRVRDFRARRTVVVRAGKRYFARAR